MCLIKNVSSKLSDVAEEIVLTCRADGSDGGKTPPKADISGAASARPRPAFSAW
jgi:hypothetical protein